MSVLSWLFGKVKSVSGVFQWQTSAPIVFTGDAYEQRTVRSIIDTIASHCAKAEALHVIVDKDEKVVKVIRNSPYAKLLNQKANPWMSAYDFKYKLFAQLEAATTAMVYVKWAGMVPEMFVPINYTTADIYPTTAGSYAVKFWTMDGENYTLPIEDLIVLRKFFQKSDLWGDGNQPIYSALNLIKAGDQAFNEAMSVSNKMRGLLKQKKAMLDPKDVEKEAELFAERYIRAASKGGILGVDLGAEYQPLDIKPSTATTAHMKEIREELYRYWHVSDSILMSDYTPEKFQAFYESVLEQRFVAAGQAFTNTCFTPTEYAHGNRIIWTTSLLLHTSIDTKIALIRDTKELGLLSINQMLGLFGYPPVEDGDNRPSSLNYVNNTIKDDYQSGAKAGESEGGNAGQSKDKDSGTPV